jgi:DNA polymerase II
MDAVKGFILTPTYRVRNGTPEIHLYGVLESRAPFVVVEDRFRPYFFLRSHDVETARALDPTLDLRDADLRTFAGEPVVRVTVAAPSDVPPLRARLDQANVAHFEADVRFAYRYLIDLGIRGSLAIHGAYETAANGARVYRNPDLQPLRWTPDLRVLSIDIETDPRARSVFSIALHGCGVEKVLIVGDHRLANAEAVADEKHLIARFLQLLGEIDPDVITGWNVVDFDLSVLARVARAHGLRLTVGRNDEEFEARRDASFTRDVRADVAGRVVLDGLALLRGAFIKLPDYRLETAAQTVLGRGKLISGDDRAEAIEHNYRENPQLFVDYNLEDARLVSEILEKTKLVPLTVERSLLTGMPLDRVNAAIASIDSLYLGELRRRRIVAPSVGQVNRAARIAGGFVMDSRPGLYDNILVFDFKSLYPSIIRTFNLDPLCLVTTDVTAAADGATRPDDIVAPNRARFRREPPGILPDLVTRLATERETAKRRGENVQANAIKILMNSMYGILGAGASRLFSPDTANAITHFGQKLIQKAAAAAEEQGLEVLYGDTDSLFIHPHEADPGAALARAETTRAAIGDAVAAHIARDYGCESFLDLEFEKMYRRFFLPEIRGGKIGSKKRYAGLVVDADGTERVEFVGLEAVRRDWSEVAKRFQRGLIDLVFHERPVESFVRSFLADLHGGRFDAELIYRKALRKGLGSYTKTTPPHVRAARKAKQNNGAIIRYTMTLDGPEPAGEETAPPDYRHYVEHQIRPVAEAILRFVGTDFDTAADLRRQLSLF